MTTPSRAGAYAWAFRDQHGGTIAADVDPTAAAAAAGDWKQAAGDVFVERGDVPVRGLAGPDYGELGVAASRDGDGDRPGLRLACPAIAPGIA
ncbi:MAG: hypothetical protein ACRDOH_36795, partial [Streptosporangiaceae bacterium]